jgi:predicted Zn-dependent protease
MSAMSMKIFPGGFTGRPFLHFAVLLCAALALAGCARNPVTGGSDVTMVSEKGEIEQGRKAHEQVIKFFGVYEDQALQDYVNEIGQNLARLSHRPELEWHFTVVDAEDINAFALPGGYIYITRGIMTYLNSEAELAAVLGHEIGHVTARHSVRQQSQSMLTGILATTAAIFSGSRAVADLASIGGSALLRGYGREMELEADRLGAEYIGKAGYEPKAIIDVVGVLKNQEIFEMDRAREEGREPRIYHGVFSTHPSADTRLQQAVEVASNGIAKNVQGRVGKEDYFKRIEGMPFGTSRAQGIVRDNRFYHADLGMTLAFPSGWVVLNQRNRLLAHTRTHDGVIQMTADPYDSKLSPRLFLEKELRGRGLSGGQELTINGMQAYTAVTRNGSPLDGGAGPVRYTVIYKDKLAFVFAGASRSSSNGLPSQDRIFVSTAQTLRNLKPSEFALAEPYRIRIVNADQDTKIAALAKDSPIPRYPVQTLRLINDLYPNKEPPAGTQVKVVEQ